MVVPPRLRRPGHPEHGESTKFGAANKTNQHTTLMETMALRERVTRARPATGCVKDGGHKPSRSQRHLVGAGAVLLSLGALGVDPVYHLGEHLAEVGVLKVVVAARLGKLVFVRRSRGDAAGGGSALDHEADQALEDAFDGPCGVPLVGVEIRHRQTQSSRTRCRGHRTQGCTRNRTRCKCNRGKMAHAVLRKGRYDGGSDGGGDGWFPKVGGGGGSRTGPLTVSRFENAPTA